MPDEKDSEQRREEWVGKKLSRRRVFEKKYQTKDPAKVAFFKHLAFDISFIDVDSQWYATVTPSWYYTWNLYKRNRFHDDLLSKQKRLEHNCQDLCDHRLYNHAKLQQARQVLRSLIQERSGQ